MPSHAQKVKQRIETAKRSNLDALETWVRLTPEEKILIQDDRPRLRLHKHTNSGPAIVDRYPSQTVIVNVDTAEAWPILFWSNVVLAAREHNADAARREADRPNETHPRSIVPAGRLATVHELAVAMVVCRVRLHSLEAWERQATERLRQHILYERSNMAGVSTGATWAWVEGEILKQVETWRRIRPESEQAAWGMIARGDALISVARTFGLDLPEMPT